MGRTAAALLLATALAGCAQPVTVRHVYVRPPVMGERIAGTYGVYVDGDMRLDPEVSGLSCRAFSFPVEANEAYRTAIANALAMFIEHVTLSTTIDQAIANGKDGTIIVRIEAVSGNIALGSQYMLAAAEAKTEIMVSTRFERRNPNKIITKLVAGSGAARHTAANCQPLSAASGGAMGLAIQHLAESVAVEAREALRQ